MATVDYVTRAEAQTQLESTNSSLNALYDALITAASRALNKRLRRELTPKTSAAARRFEVRTRVVDLYGDDLRTASAVVLHPQTSSPKTLAVGTNYRLAPVGTTEDTGTYTRLIISSSTDIGGSDEVARFGFSEIEVTGNWGAWDTAEVPEDVKRAAIVTVGSWQDRAVAEYAASGQEDPRLIRPDRFATWAIPAAAYSLVAHLQRMTTV